MTLEDLPRACRACQAWGTPQCVECPTNVARWRRATCRVLWRYRLTVAWAAVTAAGTAIMVLR